MYCFHLLFSNYIFNLCYNKFLGFFLLQRTIALFECKEPKPGLCTFLGIQNVAKNQSKLFKRSQTAAVCGKIDHKSCLYTGLWMVVRAIIVVLIIHSHVKKKGPPPKFWIVFKAEMAGWGHRRRWAGAGSYVQKSTIFFTQWLCCGSKKETQ